MRLGVNIDHVATLRQARYRTTPGLHTVEPSLVDAVQAAEQGGADSITIHLRADRRHIQDADLPAVSKTLRTRLNLELGNTPEIVAIALMLRPADVCLVPENRDEVTTEGGLDVRGQQTSLAETVAKLREAGIRVSMFIDPDAAQVEASGVVGADVVELHTGAFANATGDEKLCELARLIEAANHANQFGLVVNAGHGLNYQNVQSMHRVPWLDELNIGHSIVSRSIFVGLENAVREMKQMILDAPPSS